MNCCLLISSICCVVTYICNLESPMLHFFLHFDCLISLCSTVGTSRLISSATSSGSGDNSHQPSQSPAPLARIASSSSLSSAVSSYSNIYVQIWTVMLQLASDPYPGVKQSAQTLVNEINLKVGSRCDILKNLSKGIWLQICQRVK